MTSTLNPALVEYWQGLFRTIKFDRDEQSRANSIKSCFHAAVRLTGLDYELRDDHPYMSELNGVFGGRFLRLQTGYARGVALANNAA